MQADSITLNGTWSVCKAPLDCEGEKGLRRVQRRRRGWLQAGVPGEIHLDLIRAGKMPEPLESDNIAQCRWPEEHSWWYRRTFAVQAAFLQYERQELVFEGLDLHAQVFLNSELVASAANAFIAARVAVNRLLCQGKNELVVRMTAGSELAAQRETAPAPEHPEELYATRYWPPRRWLRKPAFAYGWDWIEPLPNIGITGDVRLEGHSHAVLADLRLDTVRQGERVFLETEAVVENIHPYSERGAALEITIVPPCGKAKTVRQRTPLELPPGRATVRDMIHLPDPQLWWPNGMGDQPLYHVTARVLSGSVECDRRELDIGLRTITIDQSPQRDGSRFCIQVNGEDVFCKGGNWGPSDAILPRAGKEKYEHLVAEAKAAHFTMFRVNGVGTYEGSAFYDACDRAGILVWQDFTYSCSTYPDHDEGFRGAARDEAEAIVASLRHHPSIALWCGSNENIWGFADWYQGELGTPQRTGGTILYNQILPDTCRRLDPHRPYWPCSPCGGENPNAELSGDCHWWLPAFMSSEPQRWLQHETYDECRSRFVSEFGAIGPCHVDSIHQYLKPDERQVDHRTWQLHSNTFEQGRTAEGIAHHYADPQGLALEDYVLYGQMFQAGLLGRAVEACRFRKGDNRHECQGALVWSYSDCWGETGWSIIDYYCRRKAAYYWYRRACKPVKVIVRQRGHSLVTRVVNDTREAVAAMVQFGWFRVDGTERRLQSKRVKVPANGMKEIGCEAIPAKRQVDPREWIYGTVLRGADVEEDQCVWALVPYRELTLPQPGIQVRRKGSGWEVTSPAYCHGVHCNDHGRAVISDNYFDLLPGVPQRLISAGGRQRLPKLQSIASRKGEER